MSMESCTLEKNTIPMSAFSFSSKPTFKEFVLGSVVLFCLIGLLGLSIIDKNCRPAFLDVAKVSIGAFMGYLIPNNPDRNNFATPSNKK